MSGFDRLSKDGNEADGESEEGTALELASGAGRGSGGGSSAGSGTSGGASDGSEGGGAADGGDSRRDSGGVRLGSASSSGSRVGSGDESGSGSGGLGSALGGGSLLLVVLRVLDLELLRLGKDAGALALDGLEVELEGRVVGHIGLGDDDGALGQVNLAEVLGVGGVAGGHVDEDQVSGLGVGADGAPRDLDAGLDIDNVVLLGVGDLDGQGRGGEKGLEEGGGGTHVGGCVLGCFGGIRCD